MQQNLLLEDRKRLKTYRYHEPNQKKEGQLKKTNPLQWP